MTDTAKDFPTTAVAAKARNELFYFNREDPARCKYGHTAPRKATNSQCIVCSFLAVAVKRDFNQNLLTFFERDSAEILPIEIAAYDSARIALQDAGYCVPSVTAEEFEDRVAFVEKAKADLGAIEDEPPVIIDDEPPAEDGAAPIEDEPEIDIKPEWGLAQSAEAFIAMIKPRVFTTNNVHAHLYRTGLKATYSGANQAIMRFKKRDWLVERGRLDRSISYTTADKFFLDQLYSWEAYCEIVPKKAKRIIVNFLTVLEPALEKTEDDIEFDELDAVVNSIKRRLDRIDGKPADDPTATPPAPDLKEADAQPVDVTADEFEDGLVSDTLDAALVGRAIVNYILELQTDAGSAEYMRQLEDKNLEVLNLRNRIQALDGKIKRQAEVLTNYESQLKQEKHLTYQLKLRIERLKSGIGDPNDKQKPGSFKVNELARINRAVKSPPTVVRRRYNEKGDATPADNK